jgi:hypothetical protein
MLPLAALRAAAFFGEMIALLQLFQLLFEIHSRRL